MEKEKSIQDRNLERMVKYQLFSERQKRVLDFIRSIIDSEDNAESKVIKIDGSLRAIED